MHPGTQVYRSALLVFPKSQNNYIKFVNFHKPCSLHEWSAWRCETQPGADNASALTILILPPPYQMTGVW
jgi:hypothetical protein